MSNDENRIMEIKKKTVDGMFWRFAERILAQGVNVLVSILLARILRPEEYGVVALLLIIINIANALVTNGFGTALIQKKEADELDYSTMLYTGIVCSFILYGLIFVLAPFCAKIYRQPILTSILRVIAIRLPIAAVNSIQQAYVAKKLMFRKFFQATLVGTVTSAFVGIWMALNGYGAWALAGQYITNVTIDTIMLFIIVNWRPKLMFSCERMKTLLRFGWKVAVTSFIGSLCSQLKGLLIGIKYTSIDLSFSSQGEKVPSFLAGNVESTLDSVLFPAMSVFQDDKSRMKAAVRRSMRTSAYVIMPLMFGLAAVSEQLVIIVLGREWMECVPYMKVACIQYALGMMGTVNLQALKALGRSDVLLKLEFIKKPFYFLILLITMQFSPMAMTIGSALYAIIASIINAEPNKRLLEYTIKEQVQDISAPSVLSVVMYILVWSIGEVTSANIGILLVQVIAGVCIYVGLSKVLRVESFIYILKLISEVRRN